MIVLYDQLFTQARPKSLLGKVMQFPLLRILLALLFVAPYLLFHNTIIADFLVSLSGPLYSILFYLDTIVTFLLILVFYGIFVKVIEKRDALEIKPKSSLQELGYGVLISFGLVVLMVILMRLLGYYQVEQVGSIKIIIDAFFRFGIGAFLQVLFFRLILFKLAEELLGSWLAFVLTALIFAIAHIANPNASLWTTVAMILTDIVFFAAFIYTRRLWLVWGLHWSHNFFQDGIFGMPNSGITDFDSWIQPIIRGPAWITGGSFGIEASVVFVLLSLCVGLFILKKAMQNHQIVPPLWKRKSQPSEPSMQTG